LSVRLELSIEAFILKFNPLFILCMGALEVFSTTRTSVVLLDGKGSGCLTVLSLAI